MGKIHKVKRNGERMVQGDQTHTPKFQKGRQKETSVIFGEITD